MNGEGSRNIGGEKKGHSLVQEGVERGERDVRGQGKGGVTVASVALWIKGGLSQPGAL